MATECFNLIHSVTVKSADFRFLGFQSRQVSVSTDTVEELGVSDIVEILSMLCDVNKDMPKFDDAVASWIASEYPCGHEELCDDYDERFAEFDRLRGEFSKWLDGGEPCIEMSVANFAENRGCDVETRIRIERVEC